MHNLHQSRWNGTLDCRQSGNAVPHPSPALRRALLKLNRTDLRAVCMTFSGHGCFARHRFLQGAFPSETCPFCTFDVENAEHFVCHCPAFTRPRLRYLGPNPTLSDFSRPENIPALVRYLRATGRASVYPTVDNAAGRTDGSPERHPFLRLCGRQGLAEWTVSATPLHPFVNGSPCS